MASYDFKIIRKPLHPNKREAVFKLCRDFLNASDKTVRVENDDWYIIDDYAGIINLKNKHTLEVFECKIIYLES